ncbi:hypothetical protein EJ994_00020 [Maribacter sp. MJ134]|nr:RHS repeat-associated core domain-containing protein [Maribacter sp. MJ134]AZQ57268.1 hypothetical protein EJ994_00020 [Maribacter sp. MJ134]
MRPPKICDRFTKFCYSYRYDALNRIIAATDNTNNYNVSNIGYDKNGNIQSLTRNGYQNSSNFTNMDVLDYDYDNGNKLTKVTDGGNGAHGFKDGTNTNDDFEYDINGNLKIDRNKGITSIEYNHLNLPTQVEFDNSSQKTITYVYDALGIKLEKKTNNNGSLNTTKYDGGFVYQNDILQFFPHPEGYVSVENGSYKYIYNYTDHLGSVRLSYTDADNNGSIDSDNEIVEENNHYPFGLQQKGYNNNVSSLGNSTAKKWKYANEEFEEDLGKNTIAYQWRDYDPTIGRFNKIDRLAENYHPISPYSFTANNPMVYREIQGDSIDVSQIVEYDNDNGTSILDNIKKDLSTITGLSFELKNGKLIHTTDDDGNAIIATDSDGNQLGSSEARGAVIGALSSTDIAKAQIVDSGGSRVTNDLGETEVGGNNINLDIGQITNQFIGGAREVDNRTMGFGMTFIHESLHSNVADGGANRDFVGDTNVDVRTGPVVDRMNIIRGQLNSQGFNFGQRQTYGARSFNVQGQTINTVLFGGNIKTVHPMPLTNGRF